MAWEQRGTKRYYYSAKKIDGRVVKTYHGNTGLASFVAQMERAGSLAIAAQRLENAAARADNRRVIAQVEHTLTETNAELLSLSVLLLQGDGYHRPKRGPWRKKWGTHYQKEQETMADFIVPESPEERNKIVNMALEKQDNKALQRQAIACMKAYPHEIRPQVTRCQTAVLERITFGNNAAYEMYRQESVILWEKLAGRDAETVPYAERLLIDRVVACHFAMIHAERLAGVDARNMKQRDYFDKCLDRAHRHYLSAIRTLAQVRRLNLPMVIAVNAPSATQVNVGGQQLNTVS